MTKRWVQLTAILVMATILVGAKTGKPPESKVKSVETFTNPIVSSGADPWVVKWQKSYYYCYSKSGGIWVSRAEKLQDIGYGEEVCVWAPPDGTPYSKELWAPELHHLDGRWFIYVAADDGDNNNHRMYALKSVSDDPQGTYKFLGKVKEPSDKWAIDGTVLDFGPGKRYFIWSGWEGDVNVKQDLYISKMKSYTELGQRVRISTPELSWELNGTPLINEGPEVLRHGARTFVIYSASGSWTDDYCLGQLELVGTDPMSPKSWVKKSKPVFQRTADVFGPGHASFVKSPDDTEDWIVYHAAKRRGSGWDRDVRIQPFTWSIEGQPVFDLPISPDRPLPVPSGR